MSYANEKTSNRWKVDCSGESIATRYKISKYRKCSSKCLTSPTSRLFTQFHLTAFFTIAVNFFKCLPLLLLSRVSALVPINLCNIEYFKIHNSLASSFLSRMEISVPSPPSAHALVELRSIS